MAKERSLYHVWINVIQLCAYGIHTNHFIRHTGPFADFLRKIFCGTVKKRSFGYQVLKLRSRLIDPYYM